MKTKEHVIIVILICAIIAGVMVNVSWLVPPRVGEMEIIVIRIYVDDSNHVGIVEFSGNVYVFQKGDAEPLHAGGIYWIRYKGRRILAFEKIGELGGG